MEEVRLRGAVFVDTSAWYAIAATDDAAHSSAVHRFRRLAARRRVAVTTNHVIGETYTLLRSRLGSRPALELLHRMRESTFVHRMFVPEAWEDEAERLLDQYHAQPFSFVDATSFVAMRRASIQEALAYDNDFLVAGFRLIGDDD